VSRVQRGMLVQPDADTCTPGNTLYIQFSAERAASGVAEAADNVSRFHGGRADIQGTVFRSWSTERGPRDEPDQLRLGGIELEVTDGHS